MKLLSVIKKNYMVNNTSNMKINILYKFSEGPYGGANQFLKGLKTKLIEQNLYSSIYTNADIIIVNSSPDNFAKTLKSIIRIVYKFPDKLIVNRIDGPVGLIRSSGMEYDKSFMLFSKYFCDGIIYQSSWSRNKLLNLNIIPKISETVILNGSDSVFFNNKSRALFKKGKKIKIIASSWSKNMKKGFDDYKWLDENLNFDKYEMTFVGNSPLNYKNIKVIPPKSTPELIKLLKSNDVYITASQNDPCSNSLIEAISCGTIAISLNDGGHAEINPIKELNFDHVSEIPQLLNYVEENHEYLIKNLTIDNLNSVSERYINFALGLKIRNNYNFLTKSIVLVRIVLNIYIRKLLDFLNFKYAV